MARTSVSASPGSSAAAAAPPASAPTRDGTARRTPASVSCRTPMTVPSSTTHADGTKPSRQRVRRNHERVIAAGFERAPRAGEQMRALVRDERRLAVHRHARALDPRRRTRSRAPDGRGRRRGSARGRRTAATPRPTRPPSPAGPGPGEITIRAGASCSISSTRDGVVAHDRHLGAQLAEPVRQIPGERVVVVDQQHHGSEPPVRHLERLHQRPRLVAASPRTPPPACESATMPAPAWMSACWPRIAMVRIAMQKSRLPAKSR